MHRQRKLRDCSDESGGFARLCPELALVEGKGVNQRGFSQGLHFSELPNACWPGIGIS